MTYSSRPRYISHPFGFNLSELIITVSMIGILAGIGAPSVSRYLSKARLNDAVLRLQGALRETQNEAIRRSQTCNLTITQGIDSVVTGNCLVTGNRPMKGIETFHNHKGGTSPWTVSFDYRGRNQAPQDPGTAVLAITGQPQLPPQCLVISIGIGLHRMGEYEGDISQKPKATDCVEK